MTPTTAKRVVLASAGGLALGSLLPWVTITAVFIGTVDLAGTKGDGRITLGLALGLAAIVLFAGIDRPWNGVALLAALAAAGTCVYDLVNISSKLDAVKAAANGMATADVGIGLWLCAASAAIAVVVVGTQLKSRPVKPAPGTALPPPAPSTRLGP